jgi:hypothetical protein
MDPIHPIIPNDSRLPILPARPANAIKRDQRPFRDDPGGRDGRDEREDPGSDEDQAGVEDPDALRRVIDLEATDEDPVASEDWAVYDNHGSYELRASGGQLHRAATDAEHPPGEPGLNTPGSARGSGRPAERHEDGAPTAGDDADPPGWRIDISA